jgi:hypothetical protein
MTENHAKALASRIRRLPKPIRRAIVFLMSVVLAVLGIVLAINVLAFIVGFSRGAGAVAWIVVLLFGSIVWMIYRFLSNKMKGFWV